MIVNNESLTKLPKGWTYVTLREISEFVRGVSYSKDESTKTPQSDLVPILRATNIDEELDFEDLVYVPPKRVQEEQYIKAFDIVIAMSSGSKELVGKAAQVRKDFLGSFGTFCGVVRVNAQLERKYIGWFFQSPNYRNSISSASSGININNLRREHVLEQLVPLSPLPEQHRIISKIEELFSDLDAGVEAWKRVKANLKRYRQAVLKAAFDGKMTAKWREEHKGELEPASVLLERIKEERKKKAKGKYKDLPPVDTSNLPELPEGWVWTRLGDIVSPSKEKCEPSDTTPEVFIGLEHIESYTGRILSPGSSVSLKSTKTRFYSGDILYGKLRPYLNKVCVPGLDGVCSTDILVFTKSEFYDSRYLARFLSRSEFVRYANVNVSGVQHPRVSFEILGEYPVSLPPLSEQKKVAEEIENRLSITDEVEQTIDVNLKRAERLRQSILKRAFEGKLVPQDPSDEPASVLLGRIKQEKERTVTAKQRWGKRKSAKSKEVTK